MTNKQKLELTWIGKENRPRLEPRILLEDPEKSYHAPPHFHALYAEHEALIDLRDFRVIRGSLPRRAMGLVLEWAADHRDELMEDWNLCSRMQTPKAIEPLK